MVLVASLGATGGMTVLRVARTGLPVIPVTPTLDAPSRVRRMQTQAGRRYRQARDIVRAEGVGGISLRLRTAGARWLQPKVPIMEVRRADVVAANLSHRYQPEQPRMSPGLPVHINWVTSPPHAGSGGHTTLFRIVNYLQTRGYSNRIYFYDVYRGDHQYYESIVRRSYGFHGVVGNVDDGMEDAHAVVATAWATAYPVFNARCSGKRFYFVQDFEPSFYPVGSLSLLADNTYRMGLYAITAGEWLATKLRAEYGMDADSFGFGCDSARYRRGSGTRSGVVFYARQEAARRGCEIGLIALEIFAARRPDIQVHVYGNKLGRLPFKAHDHGHVSPDDLNTIYNQCYAGLSLSLTNVSLVPHEMLAAGCIPVVNDGSQNRMVLDNEFVRYAPLDPHSLAASLEDVVSSPDFETLSRAAAASVEQRGWDKAGSDVDAIFRRVLTP